MLWWCTKEVSLADTILHTHAVATIPGTTFPTLTTNKSRGNPSSLLKPTFCSTKGPNDIYIRTITFCIVLCGWQTPPWFSSFHFPPPRWVSCRSLFPASCLGCCLGGSRQYLEPYGYWPAFHVSKWFLCLFQLSSEHVSGKLFLVFCWRRKVRWRLHEDGFCLWSWLACLVT